MGDLDIVGPALHKSAEEIRTLFRGAHDLGERDLSETADLVAEARDCLDSPHLGNDRLCVFNAALGELSR